MSQISEEDLKKWAEKVGRWMFAGVVFTVGALFALAFFYGMPLLVRFFLFLTEYIPSWLVVALFGGAVFVLANWLDKDDEQ